MAWAKHHFSMRNGSVQLGGGSRGDGADTLRSTVHSMGRGRGRMLMGVDGGDNLRSTISGASHGSGHGRALVGAAFGGSDGRSSGGNRGNGGGRSTGSGPQLPFLDLSAPAAKQVLHPSPLRHRIAPGRTSRP